ncbi:hypothetical protein MAR_011259 [Mya arenaria]|uniref:Uncharacterized protein n=1 Tax=Mya arenaria TaxID=6604 RepID=A0ABY7FTK2_MYAAR|nr:hypothetical protein MAR_011259 [Mya arenaria]
MSDSGIVIDFASLLNTDDKTPEGSFYELKSTVVPSSVETMYVQKDKEHVQSSHLILECFCDLNFVFISTFKTGTC